MSGFTLLSALVPSALLCAMPPDGRASALIRLGLISEGTNTWPLYVAQSLKLFERAGVTVDVTVVGSSVKQQQGLIRGGFDVGFQQADHVVRAVEQGADLFIFAPHGHAPDLTLVGAAGIGTIGELRGRDIAVDGARTGYALLLRRLLREAGLAEADIVFREVGGSQERFDAMKNAEAAASMLNPPFDANLLAAGFTSLARMSDAFPTYPGSVMAARRGWAHMHQPELAAFVRAFDEAYAWLQKPANAGEALDILPQRLAIAPRAAASVLESFAQRPQPRIDAEGLRQVIDTVWEAESYSGPKAGADKYMDLALG